MPKNMLSNLLKRALSGASPGDPVVFYRLKILTVRRRKSSLTMFAITNRLGAWSLIFCVRPQVQAALENCGLKNLAACLYAKKTVVDRAMFSLKASGEPFQAPPKIEPAGQASGSITETMHKREARGQKFSLRLWTFGLLLRGRGSVLLKDE